MGYILSSVFAALAAALYYVSHFLGVYPSGAESPLASFYIHGAALSTLSASIFFAASALPFFIYSLPHVAQRVDSLFESIAERFISWPYYLQHTLVFILCLLFVFALNMQGITRGYFHSDDFAMLAENISHPMGEILFLPYSDHVMPLFRAEIAVMYHAFGTNPFPYNASMLLLAAGVLWSAYMLLRRLGSSLYTHLIFLALFGSSIVLSSFLAGFYVLAAYTQVLIFSVMMLWAYLKWYSEAASNRALYLLFSLLCLGAAIAIDISGIWAIGALMVFSYFYTSAQEDSWSLWSYVRRHMALLCGVLVVLALFSSFMIYVFHLYPTSGVFSERALPLSAQVQSLYQVLTAGTIAELFAPSVGLIISQPRFVAYVSLWGIAMALLLLGFGLFVYKASRLENRNTRLLIYAFVLILLGVSVLPALRRPSSQTASFFPIQQIFVPFFWYIIVLAVAVSSYLKRTSPKTTRIVIAFCVLLIGWQMVFGFYKDESLQHVIASKQSVERLQTLLVPPLNNIAAQSKTAVSVPNLRGSYINPYVFGNDLWKYKAFLNLAPNIHLLDVRGGPYVASTSPLFLQALHTDEKLRTLYLAHVELEEGYQTQPLHSDAPKTFESDGEARIVIGPGTIDPAKRYMLHLDMTIPQSPEKIFLDLSYKNDFGIVGPIAAIRLDQFSVSLPDSKERRYAISVDLNQMYAYALSQSVSDVALIFTTPGHYTVYGYTLESH